jgi:hypothetical protein
MIKKIKHKVDKWFAWYPVAIGTPAVGKIAWLRKVLRIRLTSGTIYQQL